MQVSLTRACAVIKAPFQRGGVCGGGGAVPELGLPGWLLMRGRDSFVLYSWGQPAVSALVPTARRAAGCGRLAPQETTEAAAGKSGTLETQLCGPLVSQKS